MWDGTLQGSDSTARLLSGPCQGAGSGSRGSRKPAWGPPGRPLSPDAACCRGCSRLPVSVTELCHGGFHAGPQQAGPPPLHVPPPTPILARGREKAANFKSAQRLWSCPELSTINHGASDFCFASEGGVGTPGSFCLLHSAPGLCANHKQTGTQPCPASPASASSSYLATFKSPPRFLSFSSFLPSSPCDPLCLSDLILHTPLPVLLVSRVSHCPLCPPTSPRVQVSLALSLYVFRVSGPLPLLPFFLFFFFLQPNLFRVCPHPCRPVTCVHTTPTDLMVSRSGGGVQTRQTHRRVPFVTLAHQLWDSAQRIDSGTKPPLTTPAEEPGPAEPSSL